MAVLDTWVLVRLWEEIFGRHPSSINQFHRFLSASIDLNSLCANPLYLCRLLQFPPPWRGTSFLAQDKGRHPFVDTTVWTPLEDESVEAEISNFSSRKTKLNQNYDWWRRRPHHRWWLHTSEGDLSRRKSTIHPRNMVNRNAAIWGRNPFDGKETAVECVRWDFSEHVTLVQGLTLQQIRLNINKLNKIWIS